MWTAGQLLDHPRAILLGDVEVRVDELGALLPGARAHLRRNADGDAVGGDVLGHHRIGTDGGALTDGDRPEHLRPSPDNNAVLQGGVALRLCQHLPTQGHPVIEHAVIADFGGLPDDDAHAVVDEEPSPDGGPGVDFHTAGEPGNLGEGAGQELVPVDPQLMGDPVCPDRVQAGVHDEDLQRATGGRIVLLRVCDVFTDTPDAPGGK